MAKLTLNNVSSGYISTDALNTNFDLIETALENTLSRDGTSPNPMQAHLDMDGYDILNIGDALIGGVGLAASVTAAGESASEAAISAAEALASETNAAGDAAIAAAAAFELEDLEYRGAWVAATAYLKNNIVYYSTDGASYICLASHTADADFAVDLGAARWGLLALRGAAGAGTGDMLKSENLSGLANYTTARSNLGLTIGTNVQAYDADLAAIAALAVTDGNVIVGNGSTWVAESGATARTSLGAQATLVSNSNIKTVNGATILGSGEALPAPSTSGNVLTSNGSVWTSAVPSSGSMTLLDTFATTSGTTITRSGLTLTGYKFLLLAFDRVSHNGTIIQNSEYISVGGAIITPAFNGTGSVSGLVWIDLSSGITTSLVFGGEGGLANTLSSISTDTTSLAFTLSNRSFDAGSIDVYGVK